MSFIRLNARLAIRVDAHSRPSTTVASMSICNNCPIVCSDSVGNDEVRRRPGRIVIGLIDAAQGRVEDVRQPLAVVLVQFVLVVVGHLHEDGHRLRRLDDEVVDDAIARPVLVLLAVRVQIARAARASAASGRGPCLPRLSRHELIVPLAHRLRASSTRPTGRAAACAYSSDIR